MVRLAIISGQAYNFVLLALQHRSVKWITPLIVNAQSHSSLPPAHVITYDFDFLRNVEHSYAQALEKDGTTISFVRHDSWFHSIHSKITAVFTIHQRCCACFAECTEFDYMSTTSELRLSLVTEYCHGVKQA